MALNYPQNGPNKTPQGLHIYGQFHYDLDQFRPFWARKRGGKPPRKLDLRKGKFSHVLVMGLLTLNQIYSGPHGQK